MRPKSRKDASGFSKRYAGKKLSGFFFFAVTNAERNLKTSKPHYTNKCAGAYIVESGVQRFKIVMCCGIGKQFLLVAHIYFLVSPDLFLLALLNCYCFCFLFLFLVSCLLFLFSVFCFLFFVLTQLSHCIIHLLFLFHKFLLYKTRRYKKKEKTIEQYIFLFSSIFVYIEKSVDQATHVSKL